MPDAVRDDSAQQTSAAPKQPEKPKQHDLFAHLMAGGKKLSEKAKGKQKEKAKAAALPVGHALMSASLPRNSKKRKHQLSVAELCSSAGDTGVSVRQIRRDTAAIKAFAFKQTADNPDRMAAATAGVLRDPAMQQHLPTEYTQQYSEEQQSAMRTGYNTRDSILGITELGAKATNAQTQYKNTLYRGALSGNEAEFGQIAPTSRFMQQSRQKVAVHSNSKRKAVEDGDQSAGLAPKRRKRCDAVAGDPIFIEIWHTFSDQVKGQRGTKRKHVGTTEELIPIEGGGFQIRKTPKYEYHDARIQTMTCEEIAAAIKSWPTYQTWKAANPRKVQRLKTGDISAKLIAQNKCYCVGGFMSHSWGACDICTSWRYRLTGLSNSRRREHASCSCGDECEACSNHEAYFSATSSSAAFLNRMLCPTPAAKSASASAATMAARASVTASAAMAFAAGAAASAIAEQAARAARSMAVGAELKATPVATAREKPTAKGGSNSDGSGSAEGALENGIGKMVDAMPEERRNQLLQALQADAARVPVSGLNGSASDGANKGAVEGAVGRLDGDVSRAAEGGVAGPDVAVGGGVDGLDGGGGGAVGGGVDGLNGSADGAVGWAVSGLSSIMRGLMAAASRTRAVAPSAC